MAAATPACPQCQSSARVVPIVYGLLPEEQAAQVERGELLVELRPAGKKKGKDRPQRHCSKCQLDFHYQADADLTSSASTEAASGVGSGGGASGKEAEGDDGDGDRDGRDGATSLAAGARAEAATAPDCPSCGAHALVKLVFAAGRVGAHVTAAAEAGAIVLADRSAAAAGEKLPNWACTACSGRAFVSSSGEATTEPP